MDHDPVPQVKIYGIIPKTKRPPEYTWEKSFTPGPIYEYDISDFNRNLNVFIILFVIFFVIERIYSTKDWSFRSYTKLYKTSNTNYNQ